MSLYFIMPGWKKVKHDHQLKSRGSCLGSVPQPGNVFTFVFHDQWNKYFQIRRLFPDQNCFPFFFFEKQRSFKAGPPWFEFLVIFYFLHHGIEKVEEHLGWKLHKKFQRKSWSNVPPKLVACIQFLYKVVHKIDRLRKFIRSHEIEFNFLTTWTMSMKIGTLVQYAPG